MYLAEVMANTIYSGKKLKYKTVHPVRKKGVPNYRHIGTFYRFIANIYRHLCFSIVQKPEYL